MKKIYKIFDHKWASTLLWIVLIIVAWEIAATVVAANNRSPENILPHLYQILAAVFSTSKVSQGMTAVMVVLTSAKATILRALAGFLLGINKNITLFILLRFPVKGRQSILI